MCAAKRVSVKDKSPLDELFQKAEPEGKREELAKEQPASEAKTQKPKAVKKKTEKPRQTTIMLFDHQLDWLDQKCIEARSDGGKPIRKAVLIRSLLDLAISAPVDLTGLTNESELVERLEKAIRNK